MLERSMMGVLPGGGMISVQSERVYSYIEFADICEYVDWLNENKIEPERIVSCVYNSNSNSYKVVYYYYKIPFYDDEELDEIRKNRGKLPWRAGGVK